ncbi:hypothetical protein DVK44_15385 [Streptomyces paludis]|uniref:Uncharacterized protein n=1 Tax=Streptomyces paludis TaxID=2282738 RepID=A0A345HQ80_9ACTN|nr:hypothetical protein DVK44_15385 [Streptomyces paludis]
MTAALFLFMTLAQGLLAGLFVTGDAGLLTVHSAVGGTLSVVAAVQVIAAVLDRRGRARAGQPAGRRLIVLSVLALVMTVGQIGLGMARVVAPHMFIGVTTAAVAMLALLLVLTENRWIPVQVSGLAQEVR